MALRSVSMAATPPTQGASWARASTGCWRSIRMRYWRFRGRVAWAHDWVSDATLVPVFQTLPGASFIVNGALPVKDSALVSAGGELRIANGVTMLAKFDGEFAGRSNTYAGTGTIRYRW